MFNIWIIEYSATVTPFQLNAISLNWSNETMANTTSQSIGIANSHSIKIWFKPSALIAGYLYVSRNYSTDIFNIIQIALQSSGKVFLDLYNSSWTRFKRYETSTAYSIWTISSIWYTWDWTTFKIYTNWTEDTSVNKIQDNSGVMTDSDRKVYIWSNVWVNSFLNWEVSKVDIWNNTLTSAELLSLYDNWNGYKLDTRNTKWNYTSTVNLKHQWALGKNIGANIWKDFVSSGNINISDNSVNITDADIVTF